MNTKELLKKNQEEMLREIERRVKIEQKRVDEKLKRNAIKGYSKDRHKDSSITLLTGPRTLLPG